MMDRALKERIIGAAVLVVVVVLVVPVFLDGPPGSDEIVSERVPLPGQAEQKSQTVVLERDRKDPVPASAGNEPVEPTPEPQQVIRKPPAESPPAEARPTPAPVVQQPQNEAPAARQPEPTSTAPTTSTTGMWAVQLGSFSSEENAEKLAADLRKQGFAAFLSQLSTASGQLHRVRIGPQKDRASAEAVAERLQKAGQKGQVVPHP